MKKPEANDLDEYYQASESWAADRAHHMTSSLKIAWIIAGVAAAIALLEAIAIIILLPLKTVIPYTLLVDRQTGYVEELKPLEHRSVDPDTALVRSFLVQYVIGRESYDVDSLKDNYRKVALWSAEEARTRYVASVQASNPESPLASLPRNAVVQVAVRSVSSLGKNRSMVRFTTRRTDSAGASQPAENWVAVISYRFSGAAMTAEDRMTNPLGFQVVRYRRDAETLPDMASPAETQSASLEAAANNKTGTRSEEAAQ
jgi:type IV secretion system protein VirB8